MSNFTIHGLSVSKVKNGVVYGGEPLHTKESATYELTTVPTKEFINFKPLVGMKIKTEVELNFTLDKQGRLEILFTNAKGQERQYAHLTQNTPEITTSVLSALGISRDKYTSTELHIPTNIHWVLSGYFNCYYKVKSYNNNLYYLELRENETSPVYGTTIPTNDNFYHMIPQKGTVRSLLSSAN